MATAKKKVSKTEKLVQDSEKAAKAKLKKMASGVNPWRDVCIGVLKYYRNGDSSMYESDFEEILDRNDLSINTLDELLKMENDKRKELRNTAIRQVRAAFQKLSREDQEMLGDMDGSAFANAVINGELSGE